MLNNNLDICILFNNSTFDFNSNIFYVKFLYFDTDIEVTLSLKLFFNILQMALFG